MKKKLLSVLLCMTMAVSMLAGCGSKEEAKEPAAEAEKEEAEGYAQTLEFINESGHVENNFQTLHLEDVTINLLAEGADAYTSATPFQFVTGAN